MIPEFQQLQQRILRRVVIFSSLPAPFYMGYFAMIQQWAIVWLVLGILSCYGVSYCLCRRNLYRFSVVVLILSSSFGVFLFHSLLGLASGIFCYYFSILALGCIITLYGHVLLRVFVVGCPVIGLLLINAQPIVLAQTVPPILNQIFWVCNVLTSTGILMACFIFYTKEIQKRDASIRVFYSDKIQMLKITEANKQKAMAKDLAIQHIKTSLVTLNHVINNHMVSLLANISFILKNNVDADTIKKADEIKGKLIDISKLLKKVARIKKPVEVEYSDGIMMLDIENSEYESAWDDSGIKK